MQHLTGDELRSLLTAAKAASDRDHLMILVGFGHGLRASEIVTMRGSQIRDGHLTVQRLVSNSDPLLDEKTPLEQRAMIVDDGLMFELARKCSEN